MIQHPVAVINRSTVVSDEEGRRIAEALQMQVSQDFSSVWGIGAAIGYVPTTAQPNPRKFWLVILDNSDQAGALGYHDLTPEGFPIGKGFAKTDQEFGDKISVTLSHELLEMLADPYINLTVGVGENGEFVAYENCDPCEAEAFSYETKLGVLVSDFVYPRFFDATASGVQLDHMNHITAPFQILPGGYMSVWTPNGGWQQKQTSQAIPGDRARVGSRRERRRTPRHQWLVSDPHGAPSLPVEEIAVSAGTTS